MTDSTRPRERIGDYRLEELLVRTEHWDVWAGVHLVLPRQATIRITHPGVPASGVQLLREAWILEALTHPGVPRIYDCGRLIGGGAWMATEYVRGDVLEDRLVAGPMTPAAVAALVHDVAALLDFAHAKGFVHCALHPAAIVLTDGSRGWPMCVCDWGDARASDDEDPCPAEVDVLALGAIAYEALTGTPLEDAAPTPVAERIMRAVAQRAVVTAATAQLALLIDSMVADPDRRPTAAETRVSAVALATAMERELAESADFAIAMLAVDDIAGREDTIEIEALPPGEEDDGSAIDLDDLVTPPGSFVEPALAKLRRVKWTPPYGGMIGSDGEIDAAAGEIETDTPLDRSRDE